MKAIFFNNDDCSFVFHTINGMSEDEHGRNSAAIVGNVMSMHSDSVIFVGAMTDAELKNRWDILTQIFTSGTLYDDLYRAIEFWIYRMVTIPAMSWNVPTVISAILSESDSENPFLESVIRYEQSGEDELFKVILIDPEDEDALKIYDTYCTSASGIRSQAVNIFGTEDICVVTKHRFERGYIEKAMDFVEKHFSDKPAHIQLAIINACMYSINAQTGECSYKVVMDELRYCGKFNPFIPEARRALGLN
jgi:hypothetical protein